jgi:hypothetical protein
MNYFINVYEHTQGNQGLYDRYQLYSSESLDELKRMIWNSARDNWGDVNDIGDRMDDVNPSSLDIKEISSWINSAMKDYIENAKYDDEDDEDLDLYEIIIGDPYTNIEESIDFYNDYHIAEKAIPFGHGAIYFSFIGDYVTKISRGFPYILSVIKEYNVKFQEKAFIRLVSFLS